MKIAQAVRALKSGGVIAYPTETTYGLGCDPRNTKAVRRIFMIKGRDKKKTVLLVASSIAQVKKVAVLVGASLALARSHWPGPLTLVLPAKRGARISPDVVRRGEVAIRVSSSRTVRALCTRFGFPIVSTSANRSGQLECRSGKAVEKLFSKQKIRPDLILDGGMLPRRKPSTIARVKKDGTVEVLRQGSVRV